MKTCSRCKESKEFSAFYQDKSKSDGYTSRCQDCVKTAVLEWQKNNPEKKNLKNSQWIHNNRDKVNLSVQKTDQKYRVKRRTRSRAYRAKDPSKWRALHHRWYWTDPKKARQCSATWRRNNRQKCADYDARRRARKNQSPIIEKIDRLAIYERDQGRCHICKRHCSVKTFTLDHLVPLSKGGHHTALNLAVAHRSCNARMGVGRLPAQLLLLA